MSCLDHLTSTNNLCNYSNSVCKDKLIILKFTASWCGPCKMIQPWLNEQKKIYTNNLFFEVDVDNQNYEQLVVDFNINAMPTFIFYKNGVILGTVVGCDKNEIQNKLTLLNN